jgi:beta-glucosidase
VQPHTAAQIGLNSFRISLEWARVEPERRQWNQQVIEHYKEMIGSLREHGLVPIVTLNHLTLPLWVLTPPTRFTRRFGQSLLPSPLRDVLGNLLQVLRLPLQLDVLEL